MGGTAQDYGSFMKTLINDNILKKLMLIPDSDMTDYGKLITDYFVETYICDTITKTSVCRLLIHSMPQSSIYGNPYVMKDNLAIEIYVPEDKDRMPGFQRRINQIADRLIQLFNNKQINDRKPKLEARHELASNTVNYRRMFVQFSYKRIYS